MKRLLFVVTLLSGSVAYAQSDAQPVNEKALKKEWAKKLKSTDPLEFKKIVEERDIFRGETEKLRMDLSAKTAEAEELRTNYDRSKSDYDAMAAKLAELEAAGKSLSNTNAGKGGSADPMVGRVFKVQIGYFRNKDLSKYFNNHKNFSGEVDPDGSRKYTLGVFRDYWEADNFKKYLREMGVKDAWVVSYKNGKRVNIKDALENAA